jgi:hypothetical protein
MPDFMCFLFMGWNANLPIGVHNFPLPYSAGLYASICVFLGFTLTSLNSSCFA